MKNVSILVCGIGLMLSPFALFESGGSAARAADVPDYLKTIVGTETATPADIGTKNVLQLNRSMFELYDDSGKIFQKNFLATHPVILGLFSGAGGRFFPVPPRPATTRRTFRADHLSADEIRRPRHHGACGDSHAVCQQSE